LPSRESPAAERRARSPRREALARPLAGAAFGHEGSAHGQNRLSFHNPNVFYEMALRHATKLPVVQICRRKDRLPFDVNQVRTISLDTTDIYTLIPKLETYRSEIASQVRAALDGQGSSNPISVFFPGFSVTIPKAV
jgi:hypothetical protein